MTSQDDKSTGYSDALAKLAALAKNPPPVSGQWFYRQEIALDGRAFTKCRFEFCTIYVNKGTFRLDGCFFSSCLFIYGGDAQRVVRTLGLARTDLRTALPPELNPIVNPDGTISIPGDPGE